MGPGCGWTSPPQGATADWAGVRPLGADRPAEGFGVATAVCLPDPPGRRPGPNLQREPGGERVPVLRRPLRVERGRDRPVGGPAPARRAECGVGPGAGLCAGAIAAGRTREEERLEERLGGCLWTPERIDVDRCVPEEGARRAAWVGNEKPRHHQDGA